MEIEKKKNKEYAKTGQVVGSISVVYMGLGITITPPKSSPVENHKIVFTRRQNKIEGNNTKKAQP